MSAQTHEDFSRGESAGGSSDRSFGLVFAVAFAFFGLIPLLHGKPLRLWYLAASAVFLLLALTVPSVLHPLNGLWMRVGLLIGKVTNPIITGLMFFLVFTPAALVFRLLGKDPLRIKLDTAATSYWIIRQPPGPAPETMRNQF
jgi:Saxitoxin biosynthesis operon protein SxtJ